MTAKDYPYNTALTTTAVYTSAEAFANSKAVACPITSCTLKQTDCSTALVAPFDGLLSIDATTPFTIRVS